MSDNESKFNLGDNSEGYNRSVSSEGPNQYSFDNFRTNPDRRAPQGAAPNGRRPAQQPNGRRPAQQPNGRRPAQKKRAGQWQMPSVKQKRLDQRYTPQSDPRRQVRRPEQPPHPSATTSERNRRHSIQRRQQSRVKQLISYGVIALVVLGALIALSLTILFPINEIDVTGSGHYPNEQVIAASGLEMGKNIIVCKVDQVSDTLSKALPYIDHAEVKRSISGRITITVTETTGKYAVLYGEQCVILNETGKILEIASGEEAVKYAVVLKATVEKPVPGTTAVFGDGVSLEKLLMLGNSLAAASIDKITSIDLTNMSDVIVTYDARLKLQLGTLSGLNRKLALAQRVINRENEMNPSQYGTINLTVEGKAYFSETQPEIDQGVDQSVTEPGDENLIG